ncbi:sugar transporter [Aspergillus sclerotioniger CBS 115572]|uniref:Sugar transporter n=1 Tax=Aspergillus sclerotioniger CBS 115572 TaxID=1450535 RepID=A0A317WLG3_9EURO|nr:sugar transporter [Aspergillus sclerotioniger CBS 115572]PWY87233.1 sugar transporter [Aspergillus sclerotioniger CBS 115572]
MVAISNSASAPGLETSYGPAGYKGLVDNPFLLFLSLFASIGGVLFGYDQGVISGVLVMTSFDKEFPSLANNSTLQGWMVSVLTLGAMFGALANGPIADSLSRRWSILLANNIFLIGSILQAASVNVPMIFIARFIAGLAIGQLSMVVPLYISELAPPNLRGGLVALQQFGITAGIMVAFWLNFGTQHIGGTGNGQSPAAWRLPLALQCLFSLVLAVGTFFLPYTPRWLMMKDREDEAFSTLSRLRRVPRSDSRIKNEVLEIKVSVLFDKATTAAMFPGVSSPIRLSFERYKSLFVLRHLNRRLLIACALQLIQQFTGINAIIYYAPQIFEDIGLSGSSVDLLATGVIGILNFLCTIPAIMFMDRWGRRTVLIVGAVGMGISQLIVATLYAVYEHSWASHRGAGWATAAFIWVYICNFAFSIGCINWVIPSEIFPQGVRSQAVGIAIGVNWLSNFIVALITPRMLDSITFGTFYFFLAFCVFLIFWVYFFLPETKGVSIEEMDKIFGGNQAEQDRNRMSSIRHQLGISSVGAVKDDSGGYVEEVEHHDWTV